VKPASVNFLAAAKCRSMSGPHGTTSAMVSSLIWRDAGSKERGSGSSDMTCQPLMTKRRSWRAQPGGGRIGVVADGQLTVLRLAAACGLVEAVE